MSGSSHIRPMYIVGYSTCTSMPNSSICATRPGMSSIYRLASSVTMLRLTFAESPCAATGPRARARILPSIFQKSAPVPSSTTSGRRFASPGSM